MEILGAAALEKREKEKKAQGAKQKQLISHTKNIRDQLMQYIRCPMNTYGVKGLHAAFEHPTCMEET